MRAASRHLTMVMALVALMAPRSSKAAEPWTLSRAIARALEANPDARLALSRVAASAAAVEQADAPFWPRVGLSASYGWTNNPVRVFGAIVNQREFSPSLDFNDLPSSDNLNVEGQLVVPLYAGGGDRAGQRAAAAGQAAARHAARAVEGQLAFAVARAFFTVHKTRAFVGAARAAVQAFEQNLRIARQRLQAGTLLKAATLDVEVRLARAREDLVRAKNARALALHALRNLLDVEAAGFEVADEAPAAAQPPAGAPARRAELAAAREQEQLVEAGVRRSKAAYLPRVDLVASVALDAGLKHEGAGASYAAGLMLQWSLFDGFATAAGVRRGRAELAAVREQSRKLQLALELELQQAQIRLREARERLAVTDKVIALAEQSADLTRARFGQGLALATQLIDAETSLTAARVRRAEAEADERIAVAALRKALGLYPNKRAMR